MQPAVSDAARLAHGVRNYLTVIHGFAEILAAEVTDPGHAELVAEIRAAVIQVTAFTARHLASQRAIEEPLDVSAYIASAETRLRALIGPRITLCLTHPLQPLYVRIAPTSLDDALMNLAANARDAMPGGGSLAITIGVAEAWKGSDGSWCSIAVADTGHGLSADAAARLFEPFFTTRPGAGTGIGLCEVQRIVEDAGGTITVGPSASGGTEFLAHFPLAADGTPPISGLPVEAHDGADRPVGTTGRH